MPDTNARAKDSDQTDGLVADRGIAELLAIMARLRDPETGCPWDRQQDFNSIAPYTIEEAYEVVEAIRNNDLAALRQELGDLLFQVVFHAQMAAEAKTFNFADVVQSVIAKMLRRHPHVFGDAKIDDPAAQNKTWEDHKSAERGAAAAGRTADGGGALDDGVGLALPALTRALKLQARAARVGFDWPDTGPVLDKISEEIGELKMAIADDSNPQHVTEEYGDLLFVLVNFARHLSIDPEAALRAANAKFERRFGAIESRLRARGKTPQSSTLAEMDALWNQVKSAE